MARPTPLAALLALLAFAAPAAAAPPDKGDFVLKKGKRNLLARAMQLDRKLKKSGVQKMLAAANRHAGRRGGCIGSAWPSPAASDWFCFQPGDNATAEWWPQGVTGVSDAQADERWGTRQAIAVASYDACSDVPGGIEKDQCGADARPGGVFLRDPNMSPEKGVRVTFFDPATNRYRHVLLVYPYIRKDGKPSYHGVGAPKGKKGIHAGGILWYGNFIYVADTLRGLRVFDTRWMFDLGESENGTTKDRIRVGLRGRTYHGFGYRYVMPQVDTWVNARGRAQRKKTCRSSRSAVDGSPLFSWVSIDRSQRPDVMVTGEYCNGRKTGRMATWPLRGAANDRFKGQLRWDPDGKVRARHTAWLPDQNIQGGTGSYGAWWFTRSRGPETPGLLVEAGWDGGDDWKRVRRRPTAIGPEDLHCWRGRGELWTVSEHPSRRMVYGARAGNCKR